MATFSLTDLYGAGGGGPVFKNEQVFTSSGTFTVPDDVYQVYISGAGGGGGANSGQVFQGVAQNGHGGGGAASCLYVPVRVTPGASVTVTVGSGGAGGAAATTSGSSAGPNPGADGGDSQFAWVLLEGGFGGSSRAGGVFMGPYTLLNAQVGILANGGAGGQVSSDANLRDGEAVSPSFPVQPGGSDAGSGGFLARGAAGGGGSLFGRGGTPGASAYNANAGTGVNGTAYGAGGGGGGNVSRDTAGTFTAGKGGNGSGGVIIVNW